MTKDITTEPLVSIIMPTFNSEQFLQESIDSVCTQHYTNWELIISDDCSSDSTIDIIKIFCEKDSRIFMIGSDKNEGAAVSRNKAIRQSKGRFIAFLDSDDIWLPHKLSRQIAFMLSSDAALSYGHYLSIDENGRIIGKAARLPASIDYEGLLKNQVIGCLTAVYDTEKCGKMEMPQITTSEDYGLWLKILKQGHMARGLDDVVCHYRVRQNSVSSNKLKALADSWRLFRDVEQLSLLKSIVSLVSYGTRSLLRKTKSRF